MADGISQTSKHGKTSREIVRQFDVPSQDNVSGLIVVRSGILLWIEKGRRHH